MNDNTHAVLEALGFEKMGLDPDALDHMLYELREVRICVPVAGCSTRDVARIIWHAGAAAARKDVAEKRKAYLQALDLRFMIYD